MENMEKPLILSTYPSKNACHSPYADNAVSDLHQCGCAMGVAIPA